MSNNNTPLRKPTKQIIKRNPIVERPSDGIDNDDVLKRLLSSSSSSSSSSSKNDTGGDVELKKMELLIAEMRV